MRRLVDAVGFICVVFALGSTGGLEWMPRHLLALLLGFSAGVFLFRACYGE